MKGKKLIAAGLIGMLVLGTGAWTAMAEETPDLAEEAAELAEDAEALADEAAQDEDGIEGIYKMVEPTSETSAGADEDELEMLAALSEMMRLIIREDGTGSMEIMGDGTDLEWDETTITIDGDSSPYTYEDGILTLGEEDDSLQFRKMTAEELENDAAAEPLQPGDYDPDTRAGYYKLSTIEEDGEITDASVLSMVGMEVYMVLNEDNTGTMALFDIFEELTWDDDVITIEGEDAEYTYDAGTITLESDGTVMTFVYAGTPEEAPEPPAESEEADDAG